jgi:hypothetical protein
MKKLAFLLITLLSCTLISCKKPLDYKEEVFSQKYIKIYGNWQYKFSVGESGVVHKEDHTISFIPFGKFQYNNGTTGAVGIITQNENMLLLDFGSLFPNVSWASIGLTSTGDSLNLAVVNGLSSLYVRIPQ